MIEQIIVIAVLLFILVALYAEWLGTIAVFSVGILALGIARVLQPEDILAGFANEQVFVILLLLSLGDMIRQSDLIERFFSFFLSNASNYSMFMLRMVFPVAVISAFFNNTPLVAVMTPYVRSWSKKKRIPVSSLLMPLSYAAILGGSATLIGTSTNLVVGSMVEQQNVFPKFTHLTMFDYSVVGGIMILLGGMYLLLFSRFLLPDRTSEVPKDFVMKQYLVETKVKQASGWDGKTVEEVGLRNLKGLFLVEIVRDGSCIRPVRPDCNLRVGDELYFAGDINEISDLLVDNNLTIPQIDKVAEGTGSGITEVVVSHNSTLIGKTPKEASFRSTFDAAIIAVHRNGEKLSGKIGELKIKAGDVLLLFCGGDYNTLVSESLDFYEISTNRARKRLSSTKALVIVVGVLGAVVLSAIEVLPLFMGLLFVLSAAFFMKVIKIDEFYRTADYKLALLLVLALALGRAMEKTHVAEMISHLFVSHVLPLGTIPLLVCIFVLTAFLSAYITNKAAIAIIFPVVLGLAKESGLPPKMLVLTMSFAAAATFITPHGYQTNLMVFQAGGYKFKDYMRLGLPLTIIYMFVTVFVVYKTYL